MDPRDAPKIDCHCHVVDPARFPYRADTAYRPAGQEVAPLETLLRTLDGHGVRHALIVGTNSGYDRDLSPVLDALERGEGRFRGVAVVDLGIGTQDLAALKRRGIVGVAFNATFHGIDPYLGAGDLLRRMADLDLFLQLQVRDDQLLALRPLLEASPARLVVDHCGRPDLDQGLDGAAFRALLELGRAGRAMVKLSGYDKFSRERHPYADTRPYTDALVAAFGDACLWGSDWPFLRAPERIDYAPLIDLAAAIVPDPRARARLFWDTPRRLLGFPA